MSGASGRSTFEQALEDYTRSGPVRRLPFVRWPAKMHSAPHVPITVARGRGGRGGGPHPGLTPRPSIARLPSSTDDPSGSTADRHSPAAVRPPTPGAVRAHPGTSYLRPPVRIKP